MKNPPKTVAELFQTMGWTQKNLALNPERDPCDVNDPRVNCLCLRGAIWKVYREEEGSPCVKAATIIRRDFMGRIPKQGDLNGAAGYSDAVAIIRFNDHDATTKEDVIRVAELAGI